jgi:hypothetical protein
MIFKKHKPTGQVRTRWGNPFLAKQEGFYRVVGVNGEKVKVFTDASGTNKVVREGLDKQS